MIRNTFEIPFTSLNIDMALIERAMGYEGGQPNETLKEIISKSLDEAGEFCQVRAEYNVYPGVKFFNESRSISVSGIVFDVQRIVYGQLKKSDSIAVFLCTAGEEIGKRSRAFMKEGNLLEGYVYDVIGSEVADSAADFMQKDLESVAGSQGKKITNRYSPGYCRWDVAEQHKLFCLMTDNFCRIKLSPSALMDPIKSVSGFIGIGEDVRYNPYTCNLCDMKDCIYRRLRGQKK
ncbi:MAG: vitamin B12 dependent-methionine synthase activation domain-containing protein [Bacteroidota bacterium]|nr:vitamin B12 dependent-methionine synthase activation domain-containing protein [Bacteroidota bacterium]